jgi:hypothetical protein
MAFLETLKHISTALGSGSPSLTLVQPMKEILYFAQILPLGIFAEAASKRYRVPRQTILTSISFSMTYFVFCPCVAIALLYIFDIYAFVTSR